MNELCALCRKPATGFAFIDDDRYCHGDDDPEPTCYQQASAQAIVPLHHHHIHVNRLLRDPDWLASIQAAEDAEGQGGETATADELRAALGL